MDDLPSIGHNAPNSEEALRASLADKHADIAKRASDLIEAFDRAPVIIADDETASKMADFTKQFSAAIKALDGARIAEKEPFLMSGRVVDGFFQKLITGLEKPKKAILDRITAYQQEQAAAERRRRLEAEAAAAAEAERTRLAAEKVAENVKGEKSLAKAVVAEDIANQAAADAIEASTAANAKPADLVKTRGDYGSMASLRTNWIFEITDKGALDLEALRPYLAPADLEKAVRGFVRAGGRELKGARIFQSTSAVVR